MSSDNLKYGANEEYDKKYLYSLIGINENNIEKIKIHLDGLIKSDKEMIENMGSIMDSSCVNGYSWTDTMQNVINYNVAVKDNLQEMVDKYWSNGGETMSND